MGRKSSQRHKPFYRSLWIIIPLVLVIIGIGTGIVGFTYVKGKYGSRAAEFNLDEMDKMESASIIFDRNKKIFGNIFIENRDPVTIDKISDNMKNALISIEDSRYYDHDGIDYQGIFRAVVKNVGTGRIKEGASTITQQLARNSFGLTERSYERKLVEAFLAQRIEKRYTKEQILEMYFNRIYFGSGFYGVEAAARGYFGTPAKELTVLQAATLSGLIRSPTNLSPWNDPDASKISRNYVLDKMLEFKHIDKATHDQLVKAPVTVLPKKTVHLDNYAMEEVRQQVIAKIGFEKAALDGYRIYTSIDIELQKAGEAAVQKHLLEVEKNKSYTGETYTQYDARFKEREKALLSNRATAATHPSQDLPVPKYLQGALIAIDNETGGVLALVGGRNFRHSEYNRAMQAKRPAGTAFKPLVYAAAFAHGFAPSTLVSDSVMDNRLVMIGGETGILGEWGPEKLGNHYEGEITARRALAESKNAATVRLGFMIGLDSVIDLASKAGISNPLREYPSTFLGSSDQTLAELTEAYTIFPRGGSRPTGPSIVERIEKKDGTLIWELKHGTVNVVDDVAAYEVHSILKDVLMKGTAQSAYQSLGLQHFEAGGKTGTAYGFTDVMFVGYSSRVTCGVWAGYDRPREIFRGAFSKDLALPIWTDFMNATLKDFAPGRIEKPKTITEVEICTVSGLKATDRCFEEVEVNGQKVRKRCAYPELASPRQIPKDFCDIHGEGFRSFVKVLPGEEWPRAVAAVDLDALSPVMVQSLTILGPSDPYSSLKPAWATKGRGHDLVAGLPGFKPAEKVEVRRAEAVRPFEKILEESVANIAQPAPIQF